MLQQLRDAGVEGRDGAADPRQAVTDASRALAAAGQSDMIWGHVSVRDPAGRGAWVKASPWGLEEVTPERVLLVGADGAVLEGEGPRHIEYPIHTCIYESRPDVGCVVHTHAKYATAFASLDVPLRPISHEGALFAPPDIARFHLTGDLIDTVELGVALAESLGDRNAVLVSGHGIVTVGADPAAAVMAAVLLDRACWMQLQLEAAGGPRRWSSDEEAVAKRSSVWSGRQLAGGWQYLLRRAAPR